MHRDERHETLKGRVSEHLGLERVDRHTPVRQCGGRTEVQAELPFQTGRRPVVNQHGRHDRVDLDVDCGHRRGIDTMRAPRVEQSVDRRMGRRARRVELEGDPAGDNLPPATQRRYRIGQVERAAPHRQQESLWPVDRLLRRGEALRRQTGGQHTVSCRKTRLKRLHHRPEVLLDARCLRSGDRERAGCRVGRKPQDPGGRGSGADRADGRRAMPPVLVVRWVHRDAEDGLHLEAGDIPLEQTPASRAGDFPGGERGCHERRARVRERHPAHVVEVERVGRRAVGQRGP